MGKYLSVSSIFFDDNEDVIMCDIDTWILAKWNLEKGTYDTVSRLVPMGKYGDPYKMGLVIAIFHIGTSLYCIMRNTAQIIQVELETGRFVRHGMNYIVKEASCLMYTAAGVVENKIYILPFHPQDKIIIFDVTSKKYSEGSSIAEIIYSPEKFLPEQTIFRYVIHQNRVWFAIMGTDVMAEIDYANGKLCNLMHLENKLSYASGTKDEIFAINYAGNEVYSIKNDQYKKIATNESYEKYIWSGEINDKLFFVGAEGSVIVEECGTQKTEKKLIFPVSFECVDEIRGVHNMPFYDCICSGDKLYLLPFSSNGMIVVDTKTLECKHYILQISDDDFISERNKAQEVFKEMSSFTLKDFFHYIN